MILKIFGIEKAKGSKQNSQKCHVYIGVLFFLSNR